jgi:exodeoxyribonuclease VII small subunit
MPDSMAKKNTPPKTFEEAVAELEKILADIESAQAGLEDSLAKYERGTFLIQHCRAVLASAEKQMEEITRDASGALTTTPPTQEQPQ